MRFTFVGCSITVGEGLVLEKNDPSNYTNIVADHYQATISNLAQGGNCNYNIFMRALKDILTNKPDKIFVQWSALNRTWLYPEPNLDNVFMIMASITADIVAMRADNIIGLHNPIFKDKKELQKFIDQYLLLNCDYANLLKLIEYSNILTTIAKDNNCHLVMLNGIVPWTEDIVSLSTMADYSKQLSDYTKHIIEFTTRDDADIQQYLSKLAKEFNTLDKKLWVNMFDSFKLLGVDYGTDNTHPGPKSHALYAEMIINYLEMTKE